MIIILPFVLIASCSQKKNYDTEGPFIVVTSSPGGEEEYREFFPRNFSVYDNGQLVLHTEPTDNIKVGNNAPIYETELNKEEVEKIKKLIGENNFWRFREDLSDDNSLDASYIYITVNLTDESKTVGGLNPNFPNFLELADYVFDLVSDKDYRLWYKEITDHIHKINP